MFRGRSPIFICFEDEPWGHFEVAPCQSIKHVPNFRYPLTCCYCKGSQMYSKYTEKGRPSRSEYIFSPTVLTLYTINCHQPYLYDFLCHLFPWCLENNTFAWVNHLLLPPNTITELKSNCHSWWHQNRCCPKTTSAGRSPWANKSPEISTAFL